MFKEIAPLFCTCIHFTGYNTYCSIGITKIYLDDVVLTYIDTGGDTMKWFTDLKKGQKVLILINAVLAIALLVLAFSGVGLSDLFALGFIMAFLNIFSIIFARGLFKFGIDINTENAGDDVEPSDWKYMNWYMRWGGLTVAEAAVIILGLVIKA